LRKKKQFFSLLAFAERQPSLPYFRLILMPSSSGTKMDEMSPLRSRALTSGVVQGWCSLQMEMEQRLL
jgi:hypothetical protein